MSFSPTARYKGILISEMTREQLLECLEHQWKEFHEMRRFVDYAAWHDHLRNKGKQESTS